MAFQELLEVYPANELHHHEILAADLAAALQQRMTCP